MKKTIRLTEQDINNIVKESVEKILNEISRDTIASAMHNAEKKYYAAPDHSYAARKYKRNMDYFDNAWNERYKNTNGVGQDRMMHNSYLIKNGDRVYGKNPKSQQDKNMWYNKEED